MKSSLTTYPNHFSSQATISYSLDNSASVPIELFNILGEKAKAALSNTQQAKGFYQFVFNREETSLADGIYIVKLTTDDRISTRKAIMLR